MAKRDEDGLVDLLMELPWWVSVALGAVVYVGLRFVIPSIESANVIFKAFAPQAPAFAWMAVVFLLPAAFSALISWRKRRLLDTQSGIESIRSLSWSQFEVLLGEAYRRQGYSVQENRSAGPDGGIDLVIRKDGAVYLVQCKQWRAFKVGVKVVREMLGLVTAHSAQGAIVVTSGVFTQEAKRFAASTAVELIEGHELVDLVRAVQTHPAATTASPARAAAGSSPTASTRTCSRCGGQMVLREARRGSHAGSTFWGCSNYPKCKNTEPAES